MVCNFGGSWVLKLLLLVMMAISGLTEDYGNIEEVDTSGASLRTARQDNLDFHGTTASDAMAKTDLGRVNNYKSIINRVAARKGIHPALIAAIMSRESRAGNILDSTGYGDHGNGFGLMQVDVNPTGGGHTALGAWNSEVHVDQATGILVYFINRISAKYPHWSKNQQLKGGIAAYNTGDGRVPREYDNVDIYTTGGDYSNDVVARAQWYIRAGGF